MTLDRVAPEAVAIPGWSTRAAFAALRWCFSTGTPAIMMSESTKDDTTRHLLKEALKRQILSGCSAAVVGGTLHAAYLRELGMQTEQLFMGYDVVENAHFETGARQVRAEPELLRDKHSLPKRYFLASSRFVGKKNLHRLLTAFSDYRKAVGSGAWSLVLLGDGPLKPSLLGLLSELGIKGEVCLPGFKQYDELPVYYALADAFIHASTVEQWGLVVNEAMASQLPVLISNRCGCAPDLVREGLNGFTFDPENVEDVVAAMRRLSSMSPEQRHCLGAESARIIADWDTDRFASAMKSAVYRSRHLGSVRPSLLQRATLGLLLWRRSAFASADV
jgi:glycosyltransferase involved in cell wall biosynthesis